MLETERYILMVWEFLNKLNQFYKIFGLLLILKTILKSKSKISNTRELFQALDNIHEIYYFFPNIIERMLETERYILMVWEFLNKLNQFYKIFGLLLILKTILKSKSKISNTRELFQALDNIHEIYYFFPNIIERMLETERYILMVWEFLNKLNQFYKIFGLLLILKTILKSKSKISNTRELFQALDNIHEIYYFFPNIIESMLKTQRNDFQLR